MANGGGNIWPSATQGGLARGTAAVYNAIIKKRELEQVDRQLGQIDRQLDITENVEAFKRFMGLLPFLPHGPVSQLTGIQDLVGKAFPELDLNDPILATMDLNPETIQSVVGDLALKRMEEYQNTPEGRASIDRFINQITAGRGTTSDVLKAEEGVQLGQAELINNAWDYLRKDPEAMNALYRVSAGLQQPVTFQVGENRYTFDTATGATLTAELMKHFSLLDLEFEKLATSEQTDIVKELMTQLKDKDITIGRASATRIISSLYNQARGSYGEGEGPWYDLYREFSQRPDSTELLTAMAVAEGALRSGTQTIMDQLYETPEGMQLLFTGEIGNMVAGIYGTSDPDKNQALVQSIMERFAPIMGVELKDPRIGKPRYEFNSPIFIGGEDREQGSGRFETVPDASSVDPGARVGSSVGIDENDAVAISNVLKADGRAYQAGDITLAQLKEKYNPLVVQVILKSYPRGGK